MAPGPMLGSKNQSEIQKVEESERQNGNDGPAGKYSRRSSRGARLVYILGKRPQSFLSYSFENKLCGTGRRSQTASVCGVDFVLVLQKKRKKKKNAGPMLHVWPCAKSQADEADGWNSLSGESGKNGKIRREVKKQATELVGKEVRVNKVYTVNDVTL